MIDHPFEIPAWPVLAPLWVAVLVCWLAVVARRGRLSGGRVLTVVGADSYLVAVLALTLFPLQGLGAYGNQAAWFTKFNWIPVLTIDVRTFLLNVAMTIPLGLLAPLLFRVDRARGAALVGLGLSLPIELVQLTTNLLLNCGRTADVNDLLANAGGAVLGWYAFRRLLRWPGCVRLMSTLTLRDRWSAGRSAPA